MSRSVPTVRRTYERIRRPPLSRILDLEATGPDAFLGHSHVDVKRIYGGQAIGQALVAAARTVSSDRPVHSIHGHFLSAGNPAIAVRYEVDRLRDGSSFSSRAVRAVQPGAPIFTLTASFQRFEDGPTHHTRISRPATPPEVLAPFEDTLSDDEIESAAWLQVLKGGVAVEFRFPEEYPRLAVARGEARPAHQRAWVRSPETLGDDPAEHAAAFGYISDLFLLSATLHPHAISIENPRLQLASLDHSIWFHEPFRMDEWHLYEQEGSWMGHARGLARGYLYDRSGVLVASTTQEGLLRMRR